MKINRQRNPRNSRKQKETDKRFLKAVEFVLSKKTEYKVKSERAVSLRITNDPSTIAKIKAGTRGVTIEILQAFGNYFNLDFNYFFRGPTPMDYLLNVVGVEEDKNTFYLLQNLKNSDGNNSYPELQKDIKLLEQLIRAGHEEINKVNQIVLLISEEIKRIESNKITNQELQRLLKEAGDTKNVALKKYMN